MFIGKKLKKKVMSQKPSKEAKALSLFLMAYKSVNPVYKEKSKRINRLWNLVKNNELPVEDYFKELNSILDSYGGYLEVVEKTVKFYVEKTGEWSLKGEDQYSLDAQQFVSKYSKS
jgi:hypothetical protein